MNEEEIESICQVQDELNELVAEWESFQMGKIESKVEYAS